MNPPVVLASDMPRNPEEFFLSWEDTVEFITLVAEQNKVDLDTVVLHYHEDTPDHDGGHHEMGTSNYLQNRVTLCENSRAVALHELAHLWAMEHHGSKWSFTYLYLLRKYLPEDDYEREAGAAAVRYPEFMKVARDWMHEGRLEGRHVFSM